MKTIHFVDLRGQYEALKEEILPEIAQVLDGMQLFLGENVFRLEKEFAAFCQARYAVGVGSGTDALVLSLRACGVEPGDEVITVPNTFFATVEAIALVGATPVFVDVDARSHTMDPARLESAITEKTRAVIPVHLYGQPADMDPILEVARRRGLMVIEDACQAHGADYKGRRVGSLGDVAAFSFYYSKNLGAYGEAGIAVTNSREVARKLRLLRDHGSGTKYAHEVIGTNARLDEIQAAILRVKLRYLNQWNLKRRTWASEYGRRLAEVPEISAPPEMGYARHVYHLYVIRTEARDGLKKWLHQQGVQTGIHYPIPAHLQEACSHYGYERGSFPNAEAAADEILSLPIYPELSMDDVGYITQSISDFYQADGQQRRRGKRVPARQAS
jgi:dTDP-4-amino-4,6-dideoxygalactose transaminase